MKGICRKIPPAKIDELHGGWLLLGLQSGEAKIPYFAKWFLLPLELKWFFLGLKIWDRLGQKETRFAAYKSYRLIFVHPSPKDIT